MQVITTEKHKMNGEKKLIQPIFHNIFSQGVVMHQQKSLIFQTVNIPDDQTQHCELNKLHW